MNTFNKKLTKLLPGHWGFFKLLFQIFISMRNQQLAVLSPKTQTLKTQN